MVGYDLRITGVRGAVYKTADIDLMAHTLSSKTFTYISVKSLWPPGHVNPIPVFDGQVIAATVTLSVD